MSKTRRVLSGFLPFLASMALMYLVTFSVAVCFGILGMKEYQTDFAAVYEQDAQAYITWATAGVHVAYFVVFVFWFYKVRHLSYLERDARKLELKDYVWMLVLGVTVQIVVSLLLELFLPFFPEVSQSYEELISSMRLGKGFLPFITTSAIAPAAEELIFRGVTMALVGDSVPFAVLNVMQAFLFGIYHMNPVQFCYAFVIGLLLGVVYKRYHNLNACICLHASVNLCANIVSYFA